MKDLTIAGRLKAEIERFSAKLEGGHPLMTAAREGRVKPSAVASYLVGIHCLLRNTPIHLEEARRRALDQNKVALAQFFELKSAQESGHDRWAENDIALMVRAFNVGVPDCPKSMHSLVECVACMIRSEPSHYLGYILFAEDFTVHAGARWVAVLNESCGIPAQALTSITKHIELDKHHVVEGVAEMDVLLRDAGDHMPFLVALRGAMVRFERFCDEIYEISRSCAGAAQAVGAL